TFAGPWGLAVLNGWTSPDWKFYDNTQIGLRPFNGLNPAAISGEDGGAMPAAGNVYGNTMSDAGPTPAMPTDAGRDGQSSSVSNSTSSAGDSGNSSSPAPTDPQTFSSAGSVNLSSSFNRDRLVAHGLALPNGLHRTG